MNQRITVSLCSSKSAYEVKIHKKIDLEKASKKLNTKVATKYIMIFDFKNAEISLYPSGRMLIKKVKNEDEAYDVATQLLSILLL
ncbi:MAG: hypothetical protein ACE5KT_12485 [Methanosarcinales archaeon]